MVSRSASPDLIQADTSRRPARGGRLVRALRAVTVVALLATPSTSVRAVDVRLATENDFLTRNPTNDDLYTFSIAFAVDQGPFTISLRENAFTDRNAGVRFDETYLTVARPVPGLRSWEVRLGGGIVHVGRGLFGEDAQNAFHRLIGDDDVHLEYGDASLHPSFELSAGRFFSPEEHLEVGPLIEATSVPGLRSHVVLGATMRWEPGAGLALELSAGGRASHASLDALEPHLAELGAMARVGLLVNGSVYLSWTYNEYGDRREHLSIGYRIPLGGGTAWGERPR